MSQFVKIFDTTLRDGEQSPGFSMNVGEKIRVAKRLERMGVDVIEAGFPVASQGDFEAVQAISAELKEAVVAGLARANSADVDRAWQAIQNAASRGSTPLSPVRIFTWNISSSCRGEMS